MFFCDANLLRVSIKNVVNPNSTKPTTQPFYFVTQDSNTNLICKSDKLTTDSSYFY